MIEIRSPEEIENIRAAGRIVHKVLSVLCKHAAPGCPTADLNRIAEELITKEGGVAAFKGYKGYPAAICTSLNDSVVHEIPSRQKVLKEGDIISFDVGVGFNGYYADAAVTTGIGRISGTARKLIDVTRKSLDVGIAQAHESNRVSDISCTIQRYVESYNFSVVRFFVGHGIGRALHEDPEIPNFGPPDKGARLKAGMIFAIEPMVNEGSHGIKVLDDGWTAVTQDGALSAHFEHTISITKEKAEILT